MDEPDPSLSRTGQHRVLEEHFGESWKFWRWLSRQFSKTSMGVIGTVIAVSSGYIIHLNGMVAAQETKVTVLETKVLPVIQESGRLGAIQAQTAGVLSAIQAEVAGIKSTVDGHEGRISRIESNIDLDLLDRQRRQQQERADRREKRRQSR